MDQRLSKQYRAFRSNPPFYHTGRNAEAALRSAKTLIRFRELEEQGKVRLRAEEEQEGYFDVFGEPDSERERKAIIESLETYGNYWCVAEYLTSETCDVEECACPFHRDAREEWEQADSIGMCAGYRNPLDPFENCYIIQLMDSAIDAYEAEVN